MLMLQKIIHFTKSTPPDLEKIIHVLFPKETVVEKHNIALVDQKWSFGLLSRFSRYSGSYLRNSIYPKSFDTRKYPGEMIATENFYYLDLRACEFAAKQPLGFFLLFLGPWSILFLMIMPGIFWKITSIGILFLSLFIIFGFDHIFGLKRSTKGIMLLPRKSVVEEKREGAKLWLIGELPPQFSTDLSLFRVKEKINIEGLYPWILEIGAYVDSKISKESIQYELDLDLLS